MCGLRHKGTLKTEGEDYVLEVTEEARARSDVMLSGKFHHGDDLRERSLKPDPRIAEIPPDPEIQVVPEVCEARSKPENIAAVTRGDRRNMGCEGSQGCFL